MGISRLSLNHLETQTVTLIKSDSKYPSPLKLSNAQVPLCHNEIFLKFSTKIFDEIFFLTWIITRFGKVTWSKRCKNY